MACTSDHLGTSTVKRKALDHDDLGDTSSKLSKLDPSSNVYRLIARVLDKSSNKSESVKAKPVSVDSESMPKPVKARVKLSYAEVVAKPASFGPLDIRYFHADGTLRNEPLLDEPESIVYGSDVHFHLDIITQLLGISKIDKVIGVLPPNHKMKYAIASFCFPTFSLAALRDMVRSDSRL